MLLKKIQKSLHCIWKMNIISNWFFGEKAKINLIALKKIFDDFLLSRKIKWRKMKCKVSFNIIIFVKFTFNQWNGIQFKKMNFNEVNCCECMWRDVPYTHLFCSDRLKNTSRFVRVICSSGLSQSGLVPWHQPSNKIEWNYIQFTEIKENQI